MVEDCDRLNILVKENHLNEKLLISTSLIAFISDLKITLLIIFGLGIFIRLINYLTFISLSPLHLHTFQNIRKINNYAKI